MERLNSRPGNDEKYEVIFSDGGDGYLYLGMSRRLQTRST